MQKGVRSILITSPTGSGKTVLAAHMLGTAAKKGLDSWFVMHRRELVKQSIKAFGKVGIRHGVIASGFEPDPGCRVQIASIQTLARRYKRMRPPKLIIWDEGHHISAGTWDTVYKEFPKAFHIALTATPERLDGRGLGKWFSTIVKGPSVAWLIENGYLCKYRLFAPGGINTDGMHTRMGDFAKKELSDAADRPTITGDVIKHYRRLADGKRGIVFCVSVEHSKHVVEQFKRAGITAAHVDGDTDAEKRDEAIKKFESGETKILSNVELFGEGFDLPAIEVAILLRPTQSLGLYLQQVGRSLRRSPGKREAIILDHAGNCQRHGLPDEEREWSLDGRQGRKGTGGSGSAVKVCPKCFAAQFSGKLECGFCGYKFENKPRKIDEVDGDLVEVDPEVVRRQRKREQSGAETMDDLVNVGKKRGYKNPRGWAKHIFNARQARKIREGGVSK